VRPLDRTRKGREGYERRKADDDIKVAAKVRGYKDEGTRKDEEGRIG
jgi:hypothetical protein